MRKLRFASAGLAAGALLLGIAIVIGGCGNNAGNPVGYGPEGQGSEALLLVAPIADTLGNFVALGATIFAPPPSNGFRVYLEPDGQGFRPATEAPVPSAATLGSGWSIYRAVIAGYDPALATQVVARGARNGVESVLSPVTNTAFIPATTAAFLLALQPVTITQPGDSTGIAPTLAWNAVPGAVNYLIQIFDFNFMLRYAAYTSATVHQYGVGPGVIFEELPLRGGPHVMFVQGVDAGSRVFAESFIPRFFNVTVPPPTP